MKQTVTIKDDFVPEKIMASGQCFRVSEGSNETYYFIAEDKIIHIRKIDSYEFEVSCKVGDWENYWKRYFDLKRSYSDVRERCYGKNGFIDEAIDFGAGLRILQQNPWEMLITFIISQRKSMPSISKCVQALSRNFGSEIPDGFDENDEAVFAFPTPEQLACTSEIELKTCALGYRAPYVLNAARMVASGNFDLNECSKLPDDELISRLTSLKGVGPKVASCISLFGYGRLTSVPIDVWVSRAIDNYFEGENVFLQYGCDAGIMQQYVFYYMTQTKR